MKKQTFLVFLSIFLLLSFTNKANSQPPSNLKIGLNYKVKTFSQNYSLLEDRIAKSNKKIIISNSSVVVKDSVRFISNIIYQADTVLFSLKGQKANIDSVIKVLKSLASDTTGVKNKLFDTAKINSELLKLNKSKSRYSYLIDSLRSVKDSLYSTLINRMKTDVDNANIPYTRIAVLTKPISSQIHSLRKEKYLNRAYIADYLLTNDTASAKKTVGSIQDSIKQLITLRTSIREYRKLTRPFTLFPAISKRTSKYFFGNTVDTGAGQNTVVDSSNFYNFQNLSLLYTNNIGTNTTIRAQLFSVYAGPLKFDATTYFSLPKSDSSLKKKDSINALSVLANGGGNVTLNAQFPLVSFNYNSETFLDMNFTSFFSPKFSFDIDSDPSKNSGKFSSYGSAEIVNRLNIVLEKKVQVMGQCTYSSIWGNGLFMDRLGLTSDMDRKKMELWSFTLGIGLAKSFTISFTTYKSSVEQISRNLNNTLSFVTNF